MTALEKTMMYVNELFSIDSKSNRKHLQSKENKYHTITGRNECICNSSLIYMLFCLLEMPQFVVTFD